MYISQPGVEVGALLDGIPSGPETEWGPQDQNQDQVMDVKLVRNFSLSI